MRPNNPRAVKARMILKRSFNETPTITRLFIQELIKEYELDPKAVEYNLDQMAILEHGVWRLRRHND